MKQIKRKQKLFKIIFHKYSHNIVPTIVQGKLILYESKKCKGKQFILRKKHLGWKMQNWTWLGLIGPDVPSQKTWKNIFVRPKSDLMNLLLKLSRWHDIKNTNVSKHALSMKKVAIQSLSCNQFFLRCWKYLKHTVVLYARFLKSLTGGDHLSNLFGLLPWIYARIVFNIIAYFRRIIFQQAFFYFFKKIISTNNYVLYYYYILFSSWVGNLFSVSVDREENVPAHFSKWITPGLKFFM